MGVDRKYIVTESEEVMTLEELITLIREIRGTELTFEDVMNEIDYSIKHGILKEIQKMKKKFLTIILMVFIGIASFFAGTKINTADSLNLDTIAGFDATENGLMLYTKNGNGYYIEKQPTAAEIQDFNFTEKEC